MRKELLLVLILIVFFAVSGCNSVAQKRPVLSESPDEIAVGQIVASFEKTFKEGKFEADLIHFAENARIMVGGDNPVIISKDKYAERILKMRQAGAKVSYKVISWGTPKIKIISPNKANVTVINKIKTPRGKVITVNNRYIFTKENLGDWLIIERTYTF